MFFRFQLYNPVVAFGLTETQNLFQGSGIWFIVQRNKQGGHSAEGCKVQAI